MPITLTNIGIMTPPGAAVPPYVGPGDIAPGATMWTGLRAYSAATAGAPAVNLRASGDNATSDFNTLSNGNLDTGSIANFLTAHGGSLFVTKLYDQTGNGNDQAQTTAANQPGFTLSGLGSLPVMTFARASSQFLQSPNVITSNQPFCYTGVALYTNNALQDPWLVCATNVVQLSFNLAGTNPNTAFIYDGATVQAAAADGSWHALEGLFNGASSQITVDGAATAGFPGNAGIAQYFWIGFDTINYHNGQGTEAGLWLSDISSNFAAIDANAHAYWGF